MVYKHKVVFQAFCQLSLEEKVINIENVCERRKRQCAIREGSVLCIYKTSLYNYCGFSILWLKTSVVGLGSKFVMTNVTVIDGGLSTQLGYYVGDVIDGDPLWSARFLKTNPEAVMKSHLDFLKGQFSTSSFLLKIYFLYCYMIFYCQWWFFIKLTYTGGCILHSTKL